MNLEEAIKTAIDYEIRVRDAYVDAQKKVSGDAVGERIFKVLADEEQGHIDYLRSRLDEWNKSGKIEVEALATMIPGKDIIDAEVKKLEAPLDKGDRAAELDLMKGALVAEKETSDFYARMVKELPEADRPLFARFLEIEVGHQAIVQAEIDSLTGNGFWFDFQEINLEAG